MPGSSDIPWEKLKPEISAWYSKPGATQRLIVERLHQRGYNVTDRQLKEKLRKWNLQRKLQPEDIETAFRIMTIQGYSDQNFPPDYLPFPTRNQVVTFGRLKEHFRRKNIYTPFAIQLGPTRTLLQSFTSTVEQLRTSTASYCSVYIQSLDAEVPDEPNIHRNTAHGQFGSSMQDGIAAVLSPRATSSLYSLHFREAFLKVEKVLKEIHPMGMALILSILCQLAAKAEHQDPNINARPLAYIMSSFTQHASSLFAHSHPLKSVFGHLASNINHIQCLAILVVQMMIDEFSKTGFDTTHSSYWKILYLQERYCDCLYHSDRPIRSRRDARYKLWQAQQEKYTDSAPNVLYTMSNVAEDHLLEGDIDRAQALYRDAYAKAEHHNHYSRAKTRFVALEGLSKVCLRQLHISGGPPKPGVENDGITDLGPSQRLAEKINLLCKAKDLLREAFEESHIFGQNNRWAQRAAVQQDSVNQMLSEATENLKHFETVHQQMPTRIMSAGSVHPSWHWIEWPQR